MDKRKILYISQEISPYIPSTLEGDRGHKIPQSLQERGFEVRAFMPKYGCINERRNQLHEVIRLSGMNIIIDDTDHPLIIKVATLLPSRMQVYFIDNEDYFRHSPVKDLETHTSPEDNDERIIFYVRGVAETIKKLRWAPEVIHCSGWAAALAPLYLKKIYNDDPAIKNAKIVFSITDPNDMPAPLGDRFKEKLLMDNLTADDITALGDDPADFNALMRLAIEYSDAVVDAHPNISDELSALVRASGKPHLEFIDDVPDSGIIDKYIEFYDSLKN